jgi:hypothetical protein
MVMKILPRSLQINTTRRTENNKFDQLRTILRPIPIPQRKLGLIRLIKIKF